MKKLSLLTLLGTTILFSSVAFGETNEVASKAESTQAKSEERVVAKYGTEELKTSEIDEKLKGRLPQGKTFNDLPIDEQTSIVEGLVASKLMEKEAKKSDIENSQSYKKKLAEVTEHYKKLMEEVPATVMRAEFAEMKYKEFEPKDDDLKKEYASMQSKVEKEEEVQVAHILLSTEKEAKEVLAEIKGGKSFEELAKTKSIDPSTKDKGGELGYFGKDSHMDKAFEEASFTLKKSEISPIVKSSFGFHIIKLIDKRKKSIPPFEQLQKNIKHELQNKAFQEYVDKLKKQAGVEILLDQKKK